jgi:hypothetical protein
MPELIGVEVFDVGTWVGSMGPMKWSLEDIQDIIANTNALMNDGKLKPKLKFGHSDVQFWDDAEVLEGQYDGDPSIGKAENFRLKGTKIICDFQNIPDIVFTAIDKELYTNVSAEVVFIQNFGWFISAVALLGADPPAVKTLEDLQAFLSEPSTLNLDIVSGAMLAFSQSYYKLGGNMPKPVIDPKDTGKDPSSNDGGQQAVNAIVEENKTLKSEFSETQTKLVDTETKLASNEKELKEYREAAANTVFKTKYSEVMAPYEEDVKAGLLKPVMLDKIKECLNAQKDSFDLNTTLLIEPALAREVAMSYSEKLPGNSNSTQDTTLDSGVSPDDAFVMAIKEAQMKNSKLTYSEASNYVSSTKPVLLKEYTDWCEKVSASGKPQGV